ncbi:MAG: polymerase/3-5 exonuclease PolX [Patescibacteria group bacterium]|nr:polymerase/3-5 exonuclease PolX [Patescibacteria group bacterium]
MKSNATSLGAQTRAYLGGLAHLHTRLSNHPNHHESDLTVKMLVRRLTAAGLCGRPDAPLEYLMYNEHLSDPGRPRPLRRLSLRVQRLLHQRRRTAVDGVPVLFGLEVSMLADGQTDLTPQLARHRTAVIASRHHLPSELEHDPAAIAHSFLAACQDPNVDVLGHPMRYIEDVDVKWPEIFAWAHTTGTAVEVNANLFWQELETSAGRAFWQRWLGQLGQSRALVFLGLDIHNLAQAEQLVRLWQSADKGEPNELSTLLQMLQEANIGPERVVTSTYERLQRWLSIDKAERPQVFLP